MCVSLLCCVYSRVRFELRFVIRLCLWFLLLSCVLFMCVLVYLCRVRDTFLCLCECFPYVCVRVRVSSCVWVSLFLCARVLRFLCGYLLCL